MLFSMKIEDIHRRCVFGASFGIREYKLILRLKYKLIINDVSRAHAETTSIRIKISLNH